MLVTVTGHVNACRATKNESLFVISVVESVRMKGEYVKYYYSLFLNTENQRDASILQQLSETKKGTSVTIVGQCTETIETINDKPSISRTISFPTIFSINKNFDWNNSGDDSEKPKASAKSAAKPKAKPAEESPEGYDPFSDNAEGPVVEGDEEKPKSKSVWS